VGGAAEEIRYANKVWAYQNRIDWRLAARVVLRMAELWPGARVLDFGCGPGRFSHMLHESGCDVVGADVSEAMLQMALPMTSPGLKFVKLDPKVGLDYDSEFDFIFCLHVLGHVDDLHGTIEQFRRALRPNGKVLVVNPNLLHTMLRKPIDWMTGYKPDPTIKHRFTCAQLAQIMAHHGFEKEQSCSWGGRFLFAYPLFIARFTVSKD